MANRLPKTWRLVLLEDLVLSRKGKKPSKLSKSVLKDSVPYLDIKAIEKGIISNYADIESSLIADKKDVIIVWDGARSGWVGMAVEGAVGSTLMRLTPILIDSKYMFYFLKSKFEFINTQTKGIGIPHINQDIFWNIKVPLAPAQEQKRISAKLDRLLNNFNSIQLRLDEYSKFISEFKQQVLSQAINGELTRDWRKKNQNITAARKLLEKIKNDRENELKKAINNIDKEKIRYIKAEPILSLNVKHLEKSSVHKSWIKIEIKYLSKLITKGASPKWQGINYSTSGVLFITSENVGIFELLLDKKKYVEKQINKKQKRSILLKGDLLTNIVGASIGRTAIFNLDDIANINQAVSLIRLYDQIDKDYILYCMNDINTLDFMKEEKVDVARANLSLQNVGDILINLPSKKEQKEIVKRISKIFNQIEKIENQYHLLKKNIDELPNTLLEKAYSGKLVPQNPKDEPVEILLERIKKEKEKLLEQKKAVRKKRFGKKVKREVKIMEILELLKKNGKMKAEEVWKQSDYKDDIDKFYAELKKLIDIEKKVKDIKKDVNVYLELVK